ncbi:RNA 2',3'-cyclic phosphodiesterase [candidate division GN15 bacterium]|nr:RNA 2',3'-cyclic phosphodiesterase [candidate division GN15 bacterium]
MYRLFVAIDLPGNIIASLLDICYGLRGAKWTDETRMHLTLRFIGEVDGGVFRDVEEALATVEFEPFELTVKGVGHFPPRGRPETLWAGIEKSDPLQGLRTRVESALKRAGLPGDGRKFAPHIQLARVKDTPPEHVAQYLNEFALFRLPSFPVTEFSLYSSFLSSVRALHQVESTYQLVGKRNNGG